MAYALVVVAGLLLAVPSFLSPAMLGQVPSWLPHQAVALGLDLRGGASLTLQADQAALEEAMLDDYRERLEAAAQERDLPAPGIARDGNALLLASGDRVENVDLRGLAEAAMPRFQRSGLGQTEPSFDIAEAPEGQLRLTLREAAIEAARSDAVGRSIEVVRQRVDEAGIAEPSIQQVGGDRIMVQMPGVSDPSALRVLLGSTAKLGFHRVLLDQGTDQSLPDGYERLPAANGEGDYVVERRSALDGEHLSDAQSGFHPQTGQPVVQFRFDTEGALAFGELTQALVGQPFAIVLDGEVLSAPVVQEAILGGSGEITGSFTVDETTTLAALLRAGALPVPLEVIEERTVGADLGQDAISIGLWTGVAGFGLVAAIMIVLYGAWGAVATGALLINLALTIAALTLLGGTLTLPGIAGLVLGMGFAVDANVLINERIREETQRGKRAASAVQAGFDRAYRAILDSNLTTLIATTLLFWLGSGPVRGFAITMGLGILMSLFTAVTVVRAVMDVYLRVRKPKVFEVRPLLPWLARGGVPAFRFMRARYLGLAVSLVLSTASITLFVSPGLNYGVDFRGGTLIEAQLGQTTTLSDVREPLEALGLGEVTLQESGDDRGLLIRVESQPGGEAAQTRAAETVKAAVAEIAPDTVFQRVEVVGPKVSGELALAGILASVAASLAMLVYIWARFDWPFAVGAIATLVLDLTKTIGFFALTGLDFNLTAIAALLTLIGYSVNDKVVVYDRMRENMAMHPLMPLRQIIDLSINQTLGRSLYTSMTALAAMLPMAIWGGAAVQSFAVPMVFGIVIAASSSVFIAAPILLFLGDWRTRRGAVPVPPEGVQHG
ncbi:protein translocase subunit SecD [Limimaricola sp. G21655-S1]|nr:protein translocase subunit SecD [Limimaricola sp. G21655-S1]